MKNKIFALKVTTPNYDGISNIAVVEITKKLINQINKIRTHLKEIEKINPNLYEIKIFDYTPFFIKEEDTEEGSLLKLNEIIEELNICVIKDNPTNGLEEAYVDTTCLHIGKDSIRWTTYAKGTTTLLETEHISFEDLGI